MSDSTISQLPPASPLDGTELLPVDQSGVTKRILVSQLGNGSVIIAPGKTLYVNTTITLTGTDGVTVTFPSTNATLARTDAAQTFTGTQTFSSPINGDLSGTAVNATNIANVDDNTTNGTMYLLWTTSSGAYSESRVSTAKLSFNPSTGVLTATGFAGPLTGNVTGDVSGSSGSCTGNAATATALQTARTIDGQNFDGTANITVIAPGTHAAASKATPVDADELPLADSAASFVLKKLTWANVKAILAQQSFVAQDFRLTLTSGLPVTDSDITGAATIYCTPYKGNRIGLYNGSIWVNYTSAEFSLGLGTLTAALPYDVFCYQSSGMPTLEFLAWTSDSARATALAYDSGILVKSGDATRRYLGTFYTTATTTTEDSENNRYLWNYYNRAIRKMRRIESTATWSYNNTTIRQANNSTANQLNFVLGMAEDAIYVSISGQVSHDTGGAAARNYIALDSVVAGTRISGTYLTTAGVFSGLNVSETYQPAAGKHYIAWLESSDATTTTIFFGGGKFGLNGTMSG